MSGAPNLPPEQAPGRALLLAALAAYGLLIAAALLWLWARDRLAVLGERAVGSHGPLWSAALGLATGAGGAAGFARAVAAGLLPPELVSGLRALAAAAGDRAGLVVVVIGAVAEELFFRLAVQDALGLGGSVALCSALHIWIGSPSWLLFTALHALTLGLLVQLGFGLQASTSANAVFAYMTMRRMQSP